MLCKVRKNALDKMERAMGSHCNHRAANCPVWTGCCSGLGRSCRSGSASRSCTTTCRRWRSRTVSTWGRTVSTWGRACRAELRLGPQMGEAACGAGTGRGRQRQQFCGRGKR